MQNLVLAALIAAPTTSPLPSTSTLPEPRLRPAVEAPLERMPIDDSQRRWSLSLFGGVGFLDEGDFTRTLSGSTEDGSTSFDAGFATGFAVGYQVLPRWTVDFEYTYRTNDVDEILIGGDQFNSGDYASVAFMFNAVREFGDGRLRPYLGLGLGALQEVDIDLEGGAEAEADFVFAWQVKAGLNYRIAERWRLFAEARWLTAMDEELEVAGSANDTFEADYDHFGLFLGASWSF